MGALEHRVRGIFRLEHHEPKASRLVGLAVEHHFCGLHGSELFEVRLEGGVARLVMQTAYENLGARRRGKRYGGLQGAERGVSIRSSSCSFWLTKSSWRTSMRLIERTRSLTDSAGPGPRR